VLTTGGHNVGVVNPPGRAGRSHRVLTREADGKYVDPDVFLARAERHEGSWWPTWHAWLAAHSSRMVAPPTMGAPRHGLAPLCDAPGHYVLMR